MKDRLAGILLLLLIICLAGCSLPIGSTFHISPESGGTKDTMWLVPRRFLYPIDDPFRQYEDFQVFIVDDGQVEELFLFNNSANWSKINVDIIPNDNKEETIHLGVGQTRLQLYRMSKHEIIVTLLETSGYSERKANYFIEVYSPYNGGGGDGDGGIGIIWD